MKFWKRQNYWDRNQISGCPGLWHPAGVIEMFCILIVVEQQGWIWLYQTPNKEKVQFSSVSQSCPTLCDPMDCSTPDFPVYYQLPESTHHVHWVSDAIQPSHPLSSPSHPTFNISQNQGLFQWVSSLYQGGQSVGVSASASVLPMNIQDLLCVNYTSISLT